MDIITLERYECTGCGKSIKGNDYCRCRVGQEKEMADAHASIAQETERKAAERAAERADLDRLIAEAAAWAASPEGIAEEAAQEAEQERQAKAAEAFKASKAPLPARDDGLAVLRRQAAKERADAAQDADLADRERAVRGRELLRRERRQDDGDAAQETAQETADTPDGLTLDSLAAVFDAEVDLTPTLAVLERTDNGLVLPAGKLNWIYGMPGSGKSFLCEIDLIHAVLRGGRALYLDYEDSKKTFHQRAAILGFNLKDYADSFKYIHGGLAEYPAVQAEAIAWLLDAPDPEMNQVIIDAAESSGCPSDGSPVNDWLKKVVMPWRDPGVNSGVLVSDHIPKTKDNRPDGPIGSQRKLAAVDGISLLVSGYCWTKTKGGRLTLTNDKDRTGDYGRKEPVAAVIAEWQGEGDGRTFAYRIVEPTKEDANDHLGVKILNAVKDAGPEGFPGKNNLAKAIGGNRNVVFRTVDSLVDAKLLNVEKAKGSDVYTLTNEGLEYVD